jgi:hypothetical protein
MLARFLFGAVVLLISACSKASPSPDVLVREKWTGIEDLDRVIEITLSGDIDALRSIIQFTKAECTFELGLGGPPKCVTGESEGDPIEVLPFLGWEGYFIRKEDIDSWDGLSVSEVYAVYTVSDTAYTDPYAPRGTYAIVFVDEAGKGVTVQVIDDRIVRIDSLFSSSPVIKESDVDEYLLSP